MCPDAGAGGDPSLGNLLLVEGEGVSLDVHWSDASGFTDTQQVGKGEECQAGDAGLGGIVDSLGQETEEIWGSPKLWRGGGREEMEGFGKRLVEGSDCGREQGKGFQLPDGRE